MNSENDSCLEHEIIFGAATSPEYLEAIKDQIKPGTLPKEPGIVFSWLTEYYGEYKKLPNDIDSLFQLKKVGLRAAQAHLVGKFLENMRQKWPEGRGFDVPLMVSETKKYCEMRRLAVALEKAQGFLEAGDDTGAKNELQKVLKPSVKDQVKLSPMNPIPVWPGEVMRGAAGRFAKSYAAYLETPESFLFMDYLTFLGHAVSGRVSLQSELRPQTRLYTVNLGESADTRKSTSVSKTAEFYSETLPDQYHIFGVGSAEGLAKALGFNPKAVLVCDELNSLVQKMRIDGSVLLPCLCTLFEGSRFHNHTKKGEIKVDGAELCLLGASTLDTYRSMFNSRFTNIGFINRLFVVIGDSDRKFSVPEPMPDSEYETLKGDLLEVMDFIEDLTTKDRLTGGYYAYPMDPEAKEAFHSWYMGQENSVFTKRLDTYGHRLMPLMAVNELSEIITLDTVQRVISLLEYQLKARKFCDPVDADNKIAALEETIRRLLASGPMRKRDLEKYAHKARVGTWAWETALKNVGVEVKPHGKGLVYVLSKGD